VNGAFEQACRRSIEDPTSVWGEAARLIDWYREPDQILDDSNTPSIGGSWALS
jgi:propionyl-CoA synthetase